jgi:hypothetical protein
MRNGVIHGKYEEGKNDRKGCNAVVMQYQKYVV